MLSKILLTLNIDEGTGLFLAISGFIIFFFIFIFAISVLLIIMQWKIYKKAGRPGWHALIPIYNIWSMYEIVGMKGWYALTSIIPVVGPICATVFTIMSCIKLAKSFGKDTAYAIGLIFLPPIFYGILAFSKDIVYIGPDGVPMNQGNQDFNQPMNQGTQAMNQSFNQPMNQGTQPMNQSFNQPMNQGTQPMNQSFNQPMNQNFNQPITPDSQPMIQNNNQQFPNNGNM